MDRTVVVRPGRFAWYRNGWEQGLYADNCPHVRFTLCLGRDHVRAYDPSYEINANAGEGFIPRSFLFWSIDAKVQEERISL